MKQIIIIALATLPLFSIAQKSKVQSAWRALNDYESTITENPDISYLMKAKENIDLALANDETKNTAKANAYKARIMYDLYQYNLKQEQKKLEATIKDKTARVEASYVTTPFSDFDEACNAINKIKEVDAKYFDKTLGVNKVESDLGDDDLKLYNAANQMKLELSNIAIGKYKAKLFGDAADFFYKSANMNLLMTGKKDTTSYYNACICAQKAKIPAKIIFYNNEMIEKKIVVSNNFQAIYEEYITAKDSIKALEYLKMGRNMFPNDLFLMNKETDIYIQTGKQELAIVNLKKAIEKDPNNAVLEFVLGDVYNTIANPKGKNGKDTLKPENYEELTKNAEEHYILAVNLKPSNKDTYFNVLYNLGALHYNHGVVLYTKSMAKSTLVDVVRKQKEYEAKSAEYYKKAIPYFEQALSIKSEDTTTLSALRKLYYLTGNEAKGNEINAKLKAINK